MSVKADKWNKVATAFLQKKVDAWLQSEEGVAAKRLMKNANLDLVICSAEKKEGESWGKFFVFNGDGLQVFRVDSEKEKNIREILEEGSNKSRMIEHSHSGHTDTSCADLYEVAGHHADNILWIIPQQMEELASRGEE